MVTTYRSQTLNASLMRQVLGLIVTLRRHMAAHVGVFRCCRQVLGIAPSTPYWGDFQLGDRFFRVDRDEMVVALCLDDEATLLPQDDFEPHRSPHLVAARCQLLALLRGLIRRNLRRSSASAKQTKAMPSTTSLIASSSSAAENDTEMTVMMSADESLSSAYGHLMTFYEGRGDLEATIKLMDTVAKQSLYDSLFKAILVAIKAMLTFNSKNLAHVWPNIKNCHQLAGKLRKSSSFTATTKTSGITAKVRNMFFLIFSRKPVSPFDEPSDLVVHAELVHAILSVLKFCNKLAADGKAQLAASTGKLLLALKTLAKCREMAEKRTAWESRASKAQFIAAIRLEKGVRSLFISHLSPKMRRVAHLLGIKGEPGGAQGAIEELKAAAFSKTPGVFNLLSEMVLFVHCFFLKMHLLTGPPADLDLDNLAEVVYKKEFWFPKCIVYKLALAKAVQVSGTLDVAASHYKEILREKAHRLFHPVAHWELAWINAAVLDWNQAIEHMKMFGRHTAHFSVLPATLETAFRYARDDFGRNTGGGSKNAAGNLVPIKEVIAYLELTSMLRARLSGHATTGEGDAFQQTKQYFEESRMMIMPALDWLYRTNYIHLLTGNYEKTKQWLALVEDVVQEHENDSVNRDKYMLALFNKGVLLKHISRFNEATKCFSLYSSSKKHSITERVAKHIVPKASLEIGLVALASGNNSEAKDRLKDTAKYLTKKLKMSIIQIKLFGALSSIDEADHSLLELIDDSDNESELES
ncbi:Tetratricopeptide repeat protein 39B [Tyrophagus putrescentiae]|nr:Tetratricopeptide repeat protein 39B [Tyrophagus putrescentiae]